MAASPQTSLDDSKCRRCDLGVGLVEGIIGYQWGVIAEGGVERSSGDLLGLETEGLVGLEGGGVIGLE